MKHFDSRDLLDVFGAAEWVKAKTATARQAQEAEDQVAIDESHIEKENPAESCQAPAKKGVIIT